MAAEFPEMVREAISQGHTVGTHTWSHRNLAHLSEKDFKYQIEAAITTVQTVAGQPIAPFFRYPFLSSSDATVAYLKTRNIAQFAIDIDSFDWRTYDASRLVERVMSGLNRRGKGIILLHDIHASTTKALPMLLSRLKEGGFKVVHVRPKISAQIISGYEPSLNAEQQKSFTRYGIAFTKIEH
jgi:peptidoglycan/xylan/chitin deacetylase (PgdA/CDA1 family)